MSFFRPSRFLLHRLAYAAVIGLLAAGAAVAQSPGYLGSLTCKSCHQAQYRLWKNSHHAKAMQAATPETVLGDFSGVSFEYAGTTSRFYQKDGGYWVRTDGPDGELANFRVAYTFGVTPLQQYVIAFPRGHYQVLSIAWDSRPANEGGQRWFHLYPDQNVTFDDPLHWTGPYHKWNSRCADCHSTGLAKNYEVQADRYDTTWQEINVGCEACHGPGSAHAVWAKAGAEGPDPGLPVQFQRSAQWAFLEMGDATQHRQSDSGDREGMGEIERCAACHSRRAVLGSPAPGEAYLDGHRPELLQPPLYHADGQILDEVYVTGSFWQSRMHQRGVSCSDCHEPHSGELRAEGNAVCHQCHRKEVFDNAAHHHHASSSPGAQCANCHMPERTYMVVDDRRDHAIRVPDPWLSRELGTPNACNACHADKSAGWSVAALKRWGVDSPDAQRYTRLLALANMPIQSQAQARRLLAAQSGSPSIVRATALSQMNPADRQDLSYLEAALSDSEPLLRLGAVGAFSDAAPEFRRQRLWPLLEDPYKSVRLEAVRLLSAVPEAMLTPEQRNTYEAALGNYFDAQQLDFGGSWLNRAQVYFNRSEHAQAEAALKQALRLEPQLVPALINLADLYRATQRDDEARPLLEQALSIAPDSDAAQFAYGLWLIRDKQYRDALPHLARAASLAPGVARYAYVYAVALQSVGEVAQAREVIRKALARHPGHTGLKQLRTSLGGR